MVSANVSSCFFCVRRLHWPNAVITTLLPISSLLLPGLKNKRASLDEQIQRTKRDLEKMHIPQVCSYNSFIFHLISSLTKLEIGTPLRLKYNEKDHIWKVQCGKMEPYLAGQVAHGDTALSCIHETASEGAREGGGGDGEESVGCTSAAHCHQQREWEVRDCVVKRQ